MCGEDANSTETGAVYYYSSLDNGQYELLQTILPPEGSFQSVYKNIHEIRVDGYNMLLATYMDKTGKAHLYNMKNDSWDKVNSISAPPGDYLYFADSFGLFGSEMIVTSGVNLHSYSLEGC